MFNITTQTLFCQAALLAFCFAIAALFLLVRQMSRPKDLDGGRQTSVSEKVIISLVAVSAFASLILAAAVLLGI